MATEAMTGFMFWQETKLGEELKKYLPKETCRVIIDIPADGLVKVYVDCFPPKSMLNLSWPEVLGNIEIIKQESKPQSSQSGTEKKRKKVSHG